MAAGLYVPVFKKLTKTKYWKESKLYHTYPSLAETGRIMADAGQPTAAFGEVLRSYLIANTLHSIIAQGVAVDGTVSELVTGRQRPVAATATCFLAQTCVKSPPKPLDIPVRFARVCACLAVARGCAPLRRSETGFERPRVSSFP